MLTYNTADSLAVNRVEGKEQPTAGRKQGRFLSKGQLVAHHREEGRDYGMNEDIVEVKGAGIHPSQKAAGTERQDGQRAI